MVDIVKPHINDERLFYINNGLMTVYQGIFNWFIQDYFTDFKYKTMSTHDKAIEELKQYACDANTSGSGELVDAIPLPAISFNPLGDILPDPNFLHLWRFRQIGVPGVNAFIRPYEYEDEYFAYSIIRTKFKGNLEMIIWLESVYEYIDHKVMLQMWFHGGNNRRVRIDHIDTNIIIPADIIETAYQGFQYDWSNTGLRNELIKVLNQDKYFLPLKMSPQIWLTSLSDASVVYGGDDIANYKLQLTMEYDVDLPTYIVIRNAEKMENIKITFDTDIATSSKDYQIEIPPDDPDNTETYEPENNNDIWPENVKGPEQPKYIPKQTQPYLHIPAQALRICDNSTFEFKKALAYQFPNDVLSVDNHTINLDGEVVDDPDKIIVGHRKIGELIYGNTYELDLAGENIIVKIDVDKDTYWDIFIYQ